MKHTPTISTGRLFLADLFDNKASALDQRSTELAWDTVRDILNAMKSRGLTVEAATAERLERSNWGPATKAAIAAQAADHPIALRLALCKVERKAGERLAAAVCPVLGNAMPDYLPAKVAQAQAALTLAEYDKAEAVRRDDFGAHFAATVQEDRARLALVKVEKEAAAYEADQQPGAGWPTWVQARTVAQGVAA